MNFRALVMTDEVPRRIRIFFFFNLDFVVVVIIIKYYSCYLYNLQRLTIIIYYLRNYEFSNVK